MTFDTAIFLGGLAFFFFGLLRARHGLQLLAGERLRLTIAKLTVNRLKALGLGTLITLILQSSTATTVMLVSFAATGLLTLPQAFGVILGADIGTTFVVLLLSVKKIAEYSLVLIALGFFLEWISKVPKPKYLGTILFGFGLVFYGMHLLTQSASPLATNPQATSVFAFLATHPWLEFFVAFGFTVLVHTSAATIGIAVALALAGSLMLPAAIPIVLGANVGTTITALLAGVTGNVNARRVAVAHVVVKVVGAALAMPFVVELAWVMQKIAAPAATGVALFHLFFNIGLALLFLPFLPFGVWLISKIVPESRKPPPFGPLYLDKTALETPALALAQAKREILRIANLTHDLFRGSLRMFASGIDIEAVVKEIEGRDDKIDLLDREVRFYLAKISQETLTTGQGLAQMGLLSITADWEGVGDIISKELARLAQKKAARQRIFSVEGWQEIQKSHQMLSEVFNLVISAFTSPQKELIEKVNGGGEKFSELETGFRQAHFQRLVARTPEAFESSSIHLDVLTNFRRISAHLIHIAQMCEG